VKLVWGCPTYGPLDPQAVISQRIALMHAAANGVIWIGDASPDRMPFAAARNAVVTEALKSDAEAVFWCDSDVVLPRDAVTTLVRAQRDFITGIYFQRRPPHYPLIAHFSEDRETFNWFTDWPENVIAPIDGCGFGCVLTSLRLLRAMGEGPWFHYEKFSEDFDFCLAARKAGFQLCVHTGVLCGHLADPVPVTKTTFDAGWAEYQKELAHGVRSPAA
jgi:hypothetical protein